MEAVALLLKELAFDDPEGVMTASLVDAVLANNEAVGNVGKDSSRGRRARARRLREASEHTAGSAGTSPE